MNDIQVFKGGFACDDRGSVSFVNEFNFEGVKRFYMLQNHKQGFIRAWHGHKKEGKYFSVLSGAALICGVKIDNWDNPSKDLEIKRHVLCSENPTVLFLPAGYANGFMNLKKNTQIIVFSTSTLDESLNDDFRFNSRFWNPWEIIER